MRTVLANATVIDCVSPRPVPGASVTIDRGRIVEALGAGRAPDTRDAREQTKNGVHHIKLNLTGGIMGPAWDRHSQAFLLDDELGAAFAICRQRGFRVMAHAASPETVQAAARLGAHSVEHGYIMDGPSIESLRANRTWYVPTLAI